MKIYVSVFAQSGLFAVLFLATAPGMAQGHVSNNNPTAAVIDVVAVRGEIEAIDRQFSIDFRNQDSIALADHYASDGTIGSIRGRDQLITTWHKTIQGALERGTMDLRFTTVSLASDEEYVVEIGRYEYRDESGNIKSQGKYVVTWKREHGTWKIYRDIVL